MKLSPTESAGELYRYSISAGTFREMFVDSATSASGLLQLIRTLLIGLKVTGLKVKLFSVAIAGSKNAG